MATVLRIDNGGEELDRLLEEFLDNRPGLEITDVLQVGNAQQALEAAARNPIGLVMSESSVAPGVDLSHPRLRGFGEELSSRASTDHYPEVYWKITGFTVSAILKLYPQAKAVIHPYWGKSTPAEWVSTVLDAGLREVSGRVFSCTEDYKILPIDQISVTRSTRR